MYSEENLDPTVFLDSSDAQILISGVKETGIEEFTAEVEDDEQTFKVIGSDWEYVKSSTKKGSFSIKGFKATSAWLKRGFARFEILSEISNPDAVGFERVRYKNCKVKKLQLANIKAGEMINEEIEGSFSGYELLDAIE